MEEVYAALFSWALMVSGYDPPEHPPYIFKKSHVFFVRNACGGNECKVIGWFPPKGACNKEGECKDLAWFPPGDAIYIDRELNLTDSLFARSLVVHEIVHYLQQEAGALKWPYSCEKLVYFERQAYAYQQRYLSEHGGYYPTGLVTHTIECS